MTSTIVRTLAASTFLAALSVAPIQAQTHEHHGDEAPASEMSEMDHGKMAHGDMDHDAMMTMRASHMVEVRGTLISMNVQEREVTLRHNAIPTVSWPAAQMIFPVGDGVELSALTAGQPVQFTLHKAADGTLPLVELCPAQGDGVIAGLCASGTGHKSMNHDGMNHGQMDPSTKSHGAMSHDGHASPTDKPTITSTHAHGTHE